MLLAATTVLTTATAAAATPATTTTTAWRDGQFVVDTPDVVRRSDIVLGRANTDPTQFVPLGNGSLGAAVWAAGGFTAQLNRADTFPDRKSPGQLVIPGLSALTTAPDFSGHLDLYDGMLRESGGGMTLTAYIRSDKPELVVDVTGADPAATQTAQLKLWSGRTPAAVASGPVAALAETWVDDTGAGASGKTFGSMAAVTAGGRDVAASGSEVSFRPRADGSFRVIAAAPTWAGGDALATATRLLGRDATGTVSAAHLAFWHHYWNAAGLIKVSSSDGTGDYAENLRTLYLYDAAAESGGSGLPGSQAGVADLFNFSQDHQDWYPAGYWFWNLRMQVQANLSAGEFGLNSPVYRLYTGNLADIKAWTSEKMPGHEGICVPETMRFNGNGTYAGGTDNDSCDSTIAPSYNSQTITSGAEIGLWVWRQYEMTDDPAFLRANYPLIREAAAFLLSYATTGPDGLLHTTANAHETQWSVTDPVTDILAMRALFPVAVQAAKTLHVDAGLVKQLNTAIPKLPPLPRTDTATRTQNLTPADDAAGNDMIGWSTQPTAQFNNSENLGLEAVFPYNVIGDDGPMLALARRTFSSRPFVNSADWAYDPLDAARLGLAADVKSTLVDNFTKYQVYPSGLANFSSAPGNEPYIEQSGVLAATLSEALVQDYDGLLRIAPAWPADWTGEGTVAIQHNSRVSVQVSGGTVGTVAISSGATGKITLRSPWPGRKVKVVDGRGATVVSPQARATFSIPVRSGRSYLVEPVGAPAKAFAPVSGHPATMARFFGGVGIGLGTKTAISLRAHANGMYVTAENGGADPLIANRPVAGQWETFDLIDEGNGTVALQAHANNDIVTAENGGASPLIANRTAVGAWEMFQLVHNPDGSVSLKALVNSKYVTAGPAPLIADSDAIGPDQEFDLS